MFKPVIISLMGDVSVKRRKITQRVDRLAGATFLSECTQHNIAKTLSFSADARNTKRVFHLTQFEMKTQM